MVTGITVSVLFVKSKVVMIITMIAKGQSPLRVYTNISDESESSDITDFLYYRVTEMLLCHETRRSLRKNIHIAI